MPSLQTILVADCAVVTRSVCGALAAPHSVAVRPFPSPDGAPVSLGDLPSADAVIVEWDMLRAPAIGAVSFRSRQAGIPVIAVGDGDAAHELPALAVGVDRYHSLPLDLPLLRAQLSAHRRVRAPVAKSGRPAWAEERPTRAGPVSVDWAQYRAHVEGHALALTPRQFEVLAYFIAHTGEMVARDAVLEMLWGYTFDTGTNLVDVYVHHLRKRLVALGVPDPFRSVRGRGYRFDVADL